MFGYGRSRGRSRRQPAPNRFPRPNRLPILRLLPLPPPPCRQPRQRRRVPAEPAAPAVESDLADLFNAIEDKAAPSHPKAKTKTSAGRFGKGRRPGIPGWLVAVGSLAILAGGIFAVMLIVRVFDKEGNEVAKVTVPEGGTVVVGEKGGKEAKGPAAQPAEKKTPETHAATSPKRRRRPGRPSTRRRRSAPLRRRSRRNRPRPVVRQRARSRRWPSPRSTPRRPGSIRKPGPDTWGSSPKSPTRSA